MKTLILIGRVVFGAWMLANGVNHFLGQPLYPEPVGHEPLAIQLLTAFQHSRLLDVAMAMELITGVLIVAGVIIPVALCVITPVNVCAVYWALILEHQPLPALSVCRRPGPQRLPDVGLHIDYYKDMLQWNVLSLGETADSPSWNQTFAWAKGRTARMDYIKALIPLVLAAAFYTFIAAKTGAMANGCWPPCSIRASSWWQAVWQRHGRDRSGPVRAGRARCSLSLAALLFPPVGVSTTINVAVGDRLRRIDRLRSVGPHRQGRHRQPLRRAGGGLNAGFFSPSWLKQGRGFAPLAGVTLL